MVGNAIEWMQDRSNRALRAKRGLYSEAINMFEYINEKNTRLLRGGTFNGPPAVVRSAFRGSVAGAPASARPIWAIDTFSPPHGPQRPRRRGRGLSFAAGHGDAGHMAERPLGVVTVIDGVAGVHEVEGVGREALVEVFGVALTRAHWWLDRTFGEQLVVTRRERVDVLLVGNKRSFKIFLRVGYIAW